MSDQAPRRHRRGFNFQVLLPGRETSHLYRSVGSLFGFKRERRNAQSMAAEICTVLGCFATIAKHIGLDRQPAQNGLQFSFSRCEKYGVSLGLKNSEFRGENLEIFASPPCTVVDTILTIFRLWFPCFPSVFGSRASLELGIIALRHRSKRKNCGVALRSASALLRRPVPVGVAISDFWPRALQGPRRSDIATPTGAGLRRRAEADLSVAAAGRLLDAEAQ